MKNKKSKFEFLAKNNLAESSFDENFKKEF